MWVTPCGTPVAGFIGLLMLTKRGAAGLGLTRFMPLPCALSLPALVFCSCVDRVTFVSGCSLLPRKLLLDIAP